MSYSVYLTMKAVFPDRDFELPLKILVSSKKGITCVIP